MKLDNIILVGDIHGRWGELKKIVKKNPSSNIILLGDVGIGFKDIETNRLECVSSIVEHDNVKFIRGNHDNPSECNKYKTHLGDFGVFKYGDLTVGYIGGGFSVDREHRIFGYDIWEDEELDISQMNECEGVFIYDQPDIMISHEAPLSVVQELYDYPIPTRTNHFMDHLARHVLTKCKRWYCGHYHISKKIKIVDIEYTILNVCEPMELAISSDDL